MTTIRLRRLVSGALAVLCACILHLPAQAQPFAREVARFTDRLNEWTEMSEGRADGARAAWSAMDSLVLAALNGGVAPVGLDSLLSTVPGYGGASEGEGFQVGRTAFYSQLPRETPSYFVAPVRVGGRTLLLGVYSLTSMEPSRMSVYAQSAGQWRKIGQHDGRHTVAPYLLPLADSVLGIVMMDGYVGGDHSRGWVKTWRLTPSGLRLEREEPGSLLDPRVEAADSGISIYSDSVPPIISGAFLGPRLSYRTMYRARGGRIVRERTEANPWVHVVERFYALLERGRRTEARALLGDDAVYRALLAVRPHAEGEDGDLTVGDGWVRMYTDASRLVVGSHRGADGRWRIVRVTPDVSPER